MIPQLKLYICSYKFQPIKGSFVETEQPIRFTYIGSNDLGLNSVGSNDIG